MLIHLIYCSTATREFDREELITLLGLARPNNARSDITGMLLHADGSFIQVIEGEKAVVEGLFNKIQDDPRHNNITIITKEPIPQRAFTEWTMGYADIVPGEVDTIIGANDFLINEHSFAKLGKDRALRLLSAFKHGYWRGRINGGDGLDDNLIRTGVESVDYPRAASTELIRNNLYSYAFQPIINARTRKIFSFEALLRGRNNESAQDVLNSVAASEKEALDDQSRLLAINLAAHLGLTTHLNLNIIPSNAISSPTTIPSILHAAERFKILPEQIILEILESEVIEDLALFRGAIQEYRASGLLFAIDDFGAGYAGLNLLAEFQPHMIKLDRMLIRDVHQTGPRQAIIRGLLRTCFALGIEVIAEGVEAEGEYLWLRDEGVALFQGYFFARPEFEKMSPAFHLPD